MNKLLKLTFSLIIPIVIIFSFLIIHNNNIKYTKEINRYKMEIVQKEEDIKTLNKEKEELTNENNDLKSKIEEKDKEIKSLQDKNSKLESENRNLKKKLNNSSSSTSTGNKAVYQAYAHDLVINSYGWSESDFSNLVILWEKESGWNPYSKNKYSGAYGIPQALPASKMASFGDDYLTNYKTQIKWGLSYIKDRYGTPTAAMNHFNNKGWY